MKIKCSVSLSKKLREIIQNGSSVTLDITSISNGRGMGSLEFSGNVNGGELADALIGGETSIMLRPISLASGGAAPKPILKTGVAEYYAPRETGYSDVKEDEEPPAQSEDDTGTIGSLFSTTAYSKPANGPRTAVDRLAATEPPVTRMERSRAIQEEVEAPQELKALENPRLKKFIKDADAFFDAVLANKNKKSEVDVESITGAGQRAVAEERKAMDESIGVPTYIVNEKYGSLQINDLGISLPKDSPIDLSRYSAKRLYDSKDLKTIIDRNMVRFISPEEAAFIIEQSAGHGTEVDEAKTYSSYKEAKKALQESDDDDSPNELDLENGLDGPTEQEQMAGLINLTPQAPQSGMRRTTHGGGVQPRPQSPATNPNAGKTSHQQHKRVRPVGHDE